MDNDLNAPRALSVLFDFINAVKNKQIKITGKNDLNEVNKFIKKIDSVLGLNLQKEKQVIPQEIKNLAEKRENVRGLIFLKIFTKIKTTEK